MRKQSNVKTGGAFTKAKGRRASGDRRDLHQEITTKIVEAMERGAMPWLKPWHTSARHAGHPRNARTKRRYSGINILLLWLAQAERGYTSTEWLTYKQASEMGGHVREGEKSTEIVFFKPLTIKEQDANGDDVEREIPLVRTYRVFNAEQCDGLDLTAPAPPEVTADPSQLDQRFMDAVAATGAVIGHGGDRAFYSPMADKIQMPHVEQFREPAGYMAVLAHELMHWTGHKSRLDRISLANGFGQQGYAAEELVAEMGAAFACAEFGIQGELRHESYIASWIKLLKDDNRALFRAASRASKAVAYAFPEGEAAYVYPDKAKAA